MTLSNLLLIISLTTLCIILRFGDSLQVCQTVDGTWNSEIIPNSGPRNITVTWNPDINPSPRYVVQYRLQNTQIYSSSVEISSTQYTITGLTPETEYEVQVCRAVSTSSTDDCGNCLFCTSTTQAQEPPGPPTNVQVRADNSESITLLWGEPEVTNGAITNYSLLCFNNNTGETIINKTVFVVQAQTEFFLEPNSTYICSVVAFNFHGPSVPQQAVGVTPPVTTVPSLLLLVNDVGLEYAEITESALANGLTYQQLLGTGQAGTRIKGLDYHFYRGEVYMTREDLSVTRISVRLVETPQLSLTRTSNDVEVLFQRNNSDGLNSIAVDWVNDELYWIERHDTGYRIMRAVIQDNGAVEGPFCVASFTGNTATHLAVDPVHGYLYWSDTTAIYRVSLHNVRLSTTVDSCMSDIASKFRLINNVQLETFTIEPSEAIYYVGFDPCFDVPANGMRQTNRSVFGTPLNAGERRIYTGSTVPINSIDSFDRTLFFSIQNIIFVVDTSQVAVCPTRFAPADRIIAQRPLLLLRTYRSVKQPLPVPPGPPTNVLITSTSTQATVTWNAPLFIGEFFSEGAFANWTYVIQLRPITVPSGVEVMMNTSDLTVMLDDLQPEGLYELSLSACGPGLTDDHCQMTRDKLVFSTKSADSDNLLLLVATQNGVFRSRINGSSAAMVGGSSSVESNGVGYDIYTGQVYWSVAGGQGKIYMSNLNQSDGGSVIFPNFRRNPFTLNFDWVARRLFWIEDGNSVRGPKRIVYGSLENTSSIVSFDEVENVHATVLDSLNGVLFLASDRNIRAVTLGGLSFEPLCHPTDTFPFGFTVDSERRRLYWLNNDASDGHLIVNQLEYTSTSCLSNSITAEDLTGLSFSSSSTVMAYAADTLFIGSLSTDRIYTVASDLANVVDGQALAVGVVLLDLPAEDPMYRDMIIVSERLQMLPGNLQPTDRQKDLLTPSVATPPRLSELSTSVETVVEWDQSSLVQPISDTPVHYLLQYRLPPLSELQNVTSTSTSVVLQGIPPDTTLSAKVTAYSLWFPSTPSEFNTFSSLPAIPGTVTNIRAYVYRPTRGSDDLTALVLWDDPDFVVSNYRVSVFVNGVEQFPQPETQLPFAPLTGVLYQSPSNESHYIISARDFENVVNYFITAGATYQIQITAVNPSGSGSPSPLYTLDVTEPDYPQNVLVVNDSGVRLVGAEADLNHNLPMSSGTPLAVDTIGRFVYWYHEQSNSIARHSLNSDRMEVYPYLLLPDGEVLLAMAFEWVGMEVYFMLRNEENYLNIMRVSAVNRDSLSLVARLQESISPSAQVEMTVDPFGGYLHWLVVEENGTSLHQMDLRNVSSNSVVIVRSRLRRQTNQISSLNLSPALLLDPHSGNLLLSDMDSGDVVNCTVSDGVCGILVSPGDWATPQECSDTGLPARSIALNEQRLYWTGGSSSCVFAAELDNPTTLLVISSNSASKVFTLSPGQQPLPPQECLAPNVMEGIDRPEAIITDKDNTSVSLLLTIPPLPEQCNDVVISFPPVIFGINIEDGNRPIPGFPIFTYNMEYSATGLRPFTDYEVQVSVANMYTLRRNYVDELLSNGERFLTSEGVPDPPTGVNYFVFGTADIQISWTEPTFDRLKGPTPATYYVKVYGSNGTCMGELQVNESSVVVNASVGVTHGNIQDVAVIVSNRMLNSTETRIQVALWPLVPPPVLINMTNTSIAVNVVLDGRPIFEPVTHVHVEICEATESCECIGPRLVMDSRPVNTSSQEQFSFGALQAFTWYCVQSVGTYSVIEGFKSDPEVTPGESRTIQTTAGVPDPPEIGLREGMENILEWVEPNTRGEEITFYRVIAMRVGAPTADAVEFDIVRRNEVDLSEQTELMAEVVYSIRMIAVNGIGESNASNAVEFTRLQASPLSFPAIIGISIGGVVFVVIICILILLVFICSCNVWRKKELTSLSYMYGPDHELSNLRDAYRHAHANNPHYTWSRDDYVCTDEEIDLLNKFPRQSLKLETFIDRGEFGEVYQGNAIDILGPDTGPTPVAVKTLRKGTTYEEQRKFLSEASLMSKFNHPNIVKVLGVCVDNDPVYIIMELMPAGDLLKFLRDAKRDHGPTLLTLSEQIQVALDVANGCRYLELQHYIHRDIAARNCLVSSKGADRVVKIGDFGLARDLYSSDYYQVEGQRKLPVRWMAPEALLQGKFTIESDIWSYGVLLWEIMTLGNQPYPGRINQEVLQYVTGGGRLDRPDKCPGRIYHLMQSCWKRYSSERPHFDQIVTILSNFLERAKRPGSACYSDSDSDDGDSNLQRQPSGKLPSRTPSIRSGILNLARTGSMKLRNSFRRHGSIHRRDEHAVSQSAEDGQFRERGPF